MSRANAVAGGTVADLQKRLARRLGRLPGVEESESMFGHGTAYWVNGKEIAHFHSDGLVEVRLTKPVIRDQRVALRQDHRVVLRPGASDWVSVHFERPVDLDFIVALVSRAEEAHRPPPGVTAKPAPTGADLERRKRFH